MSKNKPNSLTITHESENEESLERTIDKLTQNVTILSHNIRLKGHTRQSVQIWLFRLNKLFQDIQKNLSDANKIDIALRTADDSLVAKILTAQITRYADFQNFVLSVNKEDDVETFKLNEWVRIYEEGNSMYDTEKFETGIVVQVCDNGVYEVACKHKTLKIHGSNLTKI